MAESSYVSDPVFEQKRRELRIEDLERQHIFLVREISDLSSKKETIEKTLTELIADLESKVSSAQERLKQTEDQIRDKLSDMELKLRRSGS